MQVTYYRDVFESPCCAEPLVVLRMPGKMPTHFRCRACRALYVKGERFLFPCESPEKHSEISHAAALAPPVAPARHGALETRGRRRAAHLPFHRRQNATPKRAASPLNESRRKNATHANP
jgi:hypothetical protein